MKTNQNQNIIHAIDQSGPLPTTAEDVTGKFVSSSVNSISHKAPCRSFRRANLDYLLEDYADIPIAELTSHMVLRAFAKRWNHNPPRSREARTRYTIERNEFTNN